MKSKGDQKIEAPLRWLWTLCNGHELVSRGKQGKIDDLGGTWRYTTPGNPFIIFWLAGMIPKGRGFGALPRPNFIGC